jgi:hypothetical protein
VLATGRGNRNSGARMSPFNVNVKGTMMAMTREGFEAKVGAVLRDHGVGTTADLTDELVAYWTGRRVAYVLINESPSGSSYEEFVMDDGQWKIWRSLAGSMDRFSDVQRPARSARLAGGGTSRGRRRMKWHAREWAGRRAIDCK